MPWQIADPVESNIQLISTPRQSCVSDALKHIPESFRATLQSVSIHWTSSSRLIDRMPYMGHLDELEMIV